MYFQIYNKKDKTNNNKALQCLSLGVEINENEKKNFGVGKNDRCSLVQLLITYGFTDTRPVLLENWSSTGNPL
jgi:hypothetical protein